MRSSGTFVATFTAKLTSEPLFFRELKIPPLDAYFDLIVHGSWKYFALALIAFVFYQARRLGKENTIATLASFIKSRNYTFIFIGLLIVLIFSLLFGMGELRETIMTDYFNRTIKNVVEEGTELWGYTLIFWGSLNYLFDSKKNLH